MFVEATKTFAAKICMAEGDVRDIPEGKLLSGLLSCGYVKPVKGKAAMAKKETTDEAERGIN